MRFDQSRTIFALGATGELGEDVRTRRTGADAPDALWRGLFGVNRPENVLLEQLAAMVDGRVYPRPETMSPEQASLWVKEAGAWFGAAMVGVTRLSPDHVYSHRGMKSDMLTGRFGEEIRLDHEWAVSLAVPMDYFRLQASPGWMADAEVALGYVKVGVAACLLASAIRELGYDARPHFLRREEVLHVPIAIDAGLGELSRMGMLVTGRYGPRVRLATVTTALPLISDEPAALGIREFCARCLICADRCPSRSISGGEPDSDGRWLIDPARCYEWWNAAPEKWGSCANCIVVCPWNKPDTWYHRAAVRAAGMGPAAINLLLWAEKTFYSRRHKPKPWLHYR